MHGQSLAFSSFVPWSTDDEEIIFLLVRFVRTFGIAPRCNSISILFWARMRWSLRVRVHEVSEIVNVIL